MPSHSQDIKSDMDSNEGGCAKIDSESGRAGEAAAGPGERAPAGLGADRRGAFALRDFLGPPHATRVVPDAVHRRDSLPYIDEPAGDAEEDAARSEEERPLYRDVETEDVLSSAACRLRRWRAASRKLRRPRALSGSGASSGAAPAVGTPLLVERLRGLTAAEDPASLAPPPAATAPPSPGCLLTPTLADQSTAAYFGSSPECCAEGGRALEGGADGAGAAPAPPPGPRYKLAAEGALRVCSFQHTRTVVDKILAAKFLRRWETHVLTLHQEYVVSKTPCGLLERPLHYSSMQEVFRMARWDPARKYCLRVVMPQGSLLLQANDVYTRDQWYHSIIWRRNMAKYRKCITKKIRKDEVLRELKNMVDFAMTTPLQDEEVTQVPMELLTNLLAENEDSPDWEEWAEGAASAAAPLLAERCAGGRLCALLARLCRRRPRAAPPPALAPPVRRVLTRNVDFARAPHARRLVRDYISALSSHPSGPALVRRFVEVTHGGGAACPHPRAAPNLVAVALAALDDHYCGDGPSPTTPAPPPPPPPPHTCDPDEDRVLCFADIIVHMCEWEDWRVVVAGVLQPVPVRGAALRCGRVAARLRAVLAAVARDPRCAVHSCVAPARAARTCPPSWLRAAAPANPLLALPHADLCKLWGDMIETLLKCCSKRKSFLQEMSKHLPDFLLVALTEHPAAIEALCLMLEWDVASEEQTQLEIIAALQGTELGQKCYRDLCTREQNLKRLQAEGGPRKLALPVRATDADVAALLEAGALGNLEYLSLAFTSVTSACAHHLIKLPSLRYLNLWATQFGDSGLQLIAEHLPRLQVLNLCETPVSDKGIEALSALSNLRRLNLNSTKLSAEAFADLKQRLPQLQDYDVRYTEAW